MGFQHHRITLFKEIGQRHTQRRETHHTRRQNKSVRIRQDTATGYIPYEASETSEKQLDYKSLTGNRNISQMERNVTKSDKDYKKNWSKYHRHPVCKGHELKVGDKVLLKKRKVNTCSSAHEK